jgi:hypothetical protein
LASIKGSDVKTGCSARNNPETTKKSKAKGKIFANIKNPSEDIIMASAKNNIEKVGLINTKTYLT